MILAKLCELARRECLLDHPDYEAKAVAWIISIGDRGCFLDLIPTLSEEGPAKPPKAKVLQIPRRKGRTSSPDPDFLVDKSEYVLGIEPDGKRSAKDLQKRSELFRKLVLEAIAAKRSEALESVAAFLGNQEERWRAAERARQLGYKSNDLFAFEYRGQLIHERRDMREYFSTLRRASDGIGAQCLVCGRNAVPVDKHPAVKIPGGTTSGVALVSFNSEAFESYGLSRNENAPVCRDCADAYTTALNRLLGTGYESLPRRLVKLSADTTAIYWADAEVLVLDLITDFFEAPRAESVAALMEAPKAGRQPGLVSDRFYCLILSGGQGRALIRGMLTDAVGEIETNVRTYFESIHISSEGPLPLWRLLRSLALQGKLDNLPAGLASDVFLAILFGRKFPQTLLARAVERCRTERRVPRERAAVLRAYLIRNLNWEVNVGLDRETGRAGYRLGRLMAVLEKLQMEAQGKISVTIVDRHYGAASTRPATVFSRLIGLAQHHLAKCKRPVFFQKLLGEVMEGLSVFPATLSLEEQGLFALGYYHQKQDFYRRDDTPSPEVDAEKGTAE